ncbi:sensor histidine kinase inhibitor, KipI family [Amycolatopsis xylanica]|uniref:Sensor histidine kinase inhibitor, KipI family n=1 Tax=Amycolatopsis xylanica TaxID=589385 RepID=A0A1H3PLQ5_9PSEU|nr:allophanate hydrolase subunit 1 [Amycolatopsis xylanica]SDZ01977.1 sensor histidine kinase inhibitor, KipI family [Amycolatopsis xylanica]
MKIEPYGDSALLVRPGGESAWQIVQRLADALDVPGVTDLVATYDSLLVAFDCVRVGHDELAARIRRLRLENLDAPTVSRRFEIPVVYDGPDLADVAAELGLSEDEVVRLHSGTDWVVRFLGAPAGAPMLDGSPFPARVSRRPRPRTSVPAGSVAVSGTQAVIYPVVSPGGWRLIGRTPLRLVDTSRDPMVPYRPGDRFRFVPVSGARP